MSRTAFYNEIEPYAAQWLRNLIDAGHIAPGVVDERSIEALDPDELARFGQCHFFAGIGVWSRALRLAGVPDDRPIWTGSPPCQPFSIAGKGEGHEDERHLWPAWRRLIRECKPAAILGEQVASPDGRAWLDVVLSELEDDSYAVAAADLPAASVGAPHLRQRLFFVAHAVGRAPRAGRRDVGSAAIEGRSSTRQQRVRPDAGAGLLAGVAGALADADGEPGRLLAGPRGSGQAGAEAERGGEAVELGDTVDTRLEGHAGDGHGAAGRSGAAGSAPAAGAPCRVDDTAGERRHRGRGLLEDEHAAPEPQGRSPVGGFWHDAEWVQCRPEPGRPGGSYRPIEPGTFPLVAGATERVGRLRAFGNSIVAPLAAEFAEAALELAP